MTQKPVFFRNFGKIRKISLYKGNAEDWEKSGLLFGDRSNLLVLLWIAFNEHPLTSRQPFLWLIIDDFSMKVLDGQQLLDFMEIIEDRHGRKATIIVSQLPVSDWYDVMKGNTTAADAILDRLVHTSVRFELKGDSMRRKKQQKSINSEKND